MTGTKPALQLRPLGPDDEHEFLDGHRRMMESDGFTLALNYDEGMAWADYIQRLQDMRRGRNLPEGRVPDTFLAVDFGGISVGRVSIRHELNEWLARQGGHIGYGILPEHRRNGHATEVLRQSLVIARSVGVSPSLLCCDDDNVGSATVIERCGGQLESVIDGDHGPTRRYWVP